MPTVNNFLEGAGVIAVFNAILFFTGRDMLRSMKRKGQLRRAYHGWYVWLWMMGGVAVGGCLCVWGVGPGRYAPLMMGFLGGWCGGMVHGLIALRRMPDDERAERPSL